jgi:hypothetical protein
MAGKRLKEIQAIWMMNGLEELYTCGQSFNEHDKMEHLWNFAQEDANNVRNKTGPRYSKIPDHFYRRKQFTVDMIISSRKNTLYTAGTFYRKAMSCRRRLQNIQAGWLQFLHEKKESQGKYSSGIDVNDRMNAFEGMIPMRCEANLYLLIFFNIFYR